MTPIDTATNTAGTAIAVGDRPRGSRSPPTAPPPTSPRFPGAGSRHPDRHRDQHAGTRDRGRQHPGAIAITPDGATAYVTNAISNTVTPIDTATDTPGAAIAVGSLPTSISITPDGSTAYVTNLGDDSVSVISTQTNTVSATLTGHISGFGVGIMPDQAPGAAFTSHAGAAGAATSFDAAASTDPDGSVASYGWSFGDGQNATTAGPTVAHVYANPGTYTATLTVVDDEGCSMATVFTGQTAFCNGSAAARVQHQVTVTAAPAPDPPDTAPDKAPDTPKPFEPVGRAIQRFDLASRCVRPSRSGKARVELRLLLARAMPVQVEIDRAVGTKGRKTCPRPSRTRHFPGRLKQVDEVKSMSTRPAAAAVSRRLTLGVRLAPGLYRITVRAYTGKRTLSQPARRWVRVLS